MDERVRQVLTAETAGGTKRPIRHGTTTFPNPFTEETLSHLTVVTLSQRSVWPHHRSRTGGKVLPAISV